ncbi:MAG: branched-chain amino acid ABC transporter substrate-binding protein [Anaerolineae bacterium]
MTLPVVRLGFAAPFSGPQAIVGRPMSQAAQLAVDEANEQHELPFRLELRAEDDGATPEGARAVAESFVADEALLGVVGHKNSGPSGVGAPLYAAAGLAQIAPSSTNSALSQQGYATFFRMCAHDALQGSVAARYAVRVLGARSVVVLHDGTDYGKPLAEEVAATVEREGARLALFEGIQEGGQDFSATVSRIQTIRPDLVYFGLTEIESSIVARQLRQAGVQTTLFGTDGSKESQFLPLAGEAGEGVYQTYAGVDIDCTPTAHAFAARYRARYGEPPVYGAEVYDAVGLFVAALRAAVQDDAPLTRQAILARLRSGHAFDGATGRILFDGHGDRVDPTITLWRVEGGAMRLLGAARDLIPAREKSEMRQG